MMIALGDTTERFLRSFGITKERVQAVTGKPCGCKKRQEAMNIWGYRVQQRLFRPMAWFINRWQFVKYSRPVMRVSEACRYFRMGFCVLLFGERHW
jgi:hypothetical protein